MGRLILLTIFLFGVFQSDASKHNRNNAVLMRVKHGVDGNPPKRLLDGGEKANSVHPQQSNVDRRLDVSEAPTVSDIPTYSLSPSPSLSISPSPTYTEFPSLSNPPFFTSTPTLAPVPNNTPPVPTLAPDLNNTPPVPTLSPVRNMTPTPRPVPIPSPPCFSGMNTVEVEGTGEVAINQVKVGDFIKAGNNDFTQVYGFGHIDPDLEADFLQIVLADDSPSIEMTSRHLVYVKRNNHLYSMPASDIVVGDELSGKSVQAIRTVTRRGVYAPLTQSGDILVSGVRASNYVDVLDYSLVWDQHVYAHAFFFPQRLFCRFFLDTCKKEMYVKGYGLLAYTTIGLGSIVNHGGPFAILMFSFVCIPIVGIAYAMEAMMCMGMNYYFMVALVALTVLTIVKRIRSKY
jgi:Hint module